VNKPRGPYLKADMNVYRANPATNHCVNSLKDCRYIKDQRALLQLLGYDGKAYSAGFSLPAHILEFPNVSSTREVSVLKNTAATHSLGR
jgi:hypothetical protein